MLRLSCHVKKLAVSIFFSSCISFSSLTYATDLPNVMATSQTGFTLPDDRIIIFHGVNVMNKQPPHTPSAIGFDKRHVHFIKAQGFNLVRLGVFWAAIEPNAPQPPNYKPIYDDAYLAEINKTVGLLADQGIYTLIDFHQDAYSAAHGNAGMGEPVWTASNRDEDNIGFPLNYFGGLKVGSKSVPMMIDHDFDRFWSNAQLEDKRGLQDAYADMVRHTVNYFKSTTSVIGYEIMNEPFPGSDWKKCAKKVGDFPVSFSPGCAQFEQQSLAPFYNKIIKVINQTDPTAIVFYEPVVLVGLNAPTLLPKLQGNNLALSYHNYNLIKPSTPFNYANQYVEKVAGGIPQVMTEFGATEPEKVVNEMLAQADSIGLSWTYWSYANNPTYSFYNLPGTKPHDPVKQGLVFALNKSLNDSDNVQKDRLALLMRPYPQIIAGTQPSYEYSPKTKKFRLTYTSGKVGKIAGRTEIFLPATLYHDSCNIKVENATRINCDNPQSLCIQNNNSNKKVTVTIEKK